MARRVLGGRYFITKRLARGRFSDTYLAEDRQLPNNPWCVVKHFKPKSTDALTLQTARQLFEVEAKILYQMGRRHPQIPQLLAHFEENREFYLVQEFVEGHSLSDELMPGERLAEGRVIQLLQDILGILAFVHQQGVIHRDIKPKNLIRRQEDGRIVLIDFGAVKQISTQESKSQEAATISLAVGTLGYMPNEQQGGKPRFSSDIYAVGMLALQAVTGLAPHQLEEEEATGEILWREQAQVSQALAAILDKMVRTHFKDRYKSVTEVLQDLQDLRRAQAPGSRVSEPAKLPVAKLPAARSRLYETVVSAVLLLILAGYGYWRWVESFGRPSRTATPLEELTLSQTLMAHTGPVFSVVISPDGQILASGSGDRTIRLWNLRTGALLQVLSGHRSEVVSLAISPDGQTLASGSRDQTIKIWRLRTGQLLRSLPQQADQPKSLAISPDGQTLVSGGEDKTIRLWELRTGQLLRSFAGHGAEVESVAISPDGQILVSGSEDKTVRIWNLRTAQLLQTLSGHISEVETVAISADGQVLVSGGDDKTLLWKLGTGQLLRSLAGQSGLMRSVALSLDGQILVSGGKDAVKVWSLRTGQLLRTLSGHSDWVLSVAVSADGQTLVSGARDKTIKIWRVQAAN